MLYEALLLLAVAFFAGSLFLFASGGRDATVGWQRHALQAFMPWYARLFPVVLAARRPNAAMKA